MRHHPSSLSLHRIAAHMSARTPFRGGPRGRGRRSFSDRPPFSAATTAVSGDSHFQSVRDTNSAFHHRRNNNNSTNLNSNNRNEGFQFQPHIQNYKPKPSPPYNRRPNQHKPADYRTWEYATNPPSSLSERFVVLSYNILADYLASSHRNLYFHIPRRFMSWDWRKGNILFELGLWSPDIMCFQEVDRFQELEADLRHRGYSGIWKMRTGEAMDGCAIFWRKSRFKLVYEESIEFNKLAMRDNVAQICVLESLIENLTDKKFASSASTEGPNRVVVCNIHVLYNPKRGEIKLGQVRVLMERAQAVSKKWDDASVVVCGDFNGTPKSPLYNFISEQELDISELQRDKVSGQASAELCPPPRQYGRPARGYSTGDVASLTMIENVSVDGKQETSVDNQKSSESITGNVPIVKHVSQSTSEPPLDVSDKVCSDSLNSGMISEEASIGTSYVIEDLSESKENAGVPITVSTDNVKDEGHSGLTEKKTNLIKYARSADLLVSESQQGPDLSFSLVFAETDIGSDVLPKHVPEGTPTSEQDDRNYSVFPSSNDPIKKIVEEDTWDICNRSNSQSDSSCYNSCSEIVEAPMLGAASDMPSQVVHGKANPDPNLYETSETNTSLFSKNDIDEKLAGLALNESDESVEDSEELAEDALKFMSELNNDEDMLSSVPGDFENLSSTHSKAIDVNKTSYDPSVWTPMEIATATGNANSTILGHSIKLSSTYTEVEDRSGTRDSNGEPLVTSYNSCFMGTVDYVWRSEGLKTVKVLAPISKTTMQPTGGFPTKKWGSDHIALVSELAFMK